MSDRDDYSASADASSEEVEANALLPRLRLIEDQPLETRAAAFAQIHQELQSRLESGDGSSAG